MGNAIMGVKVKVKQGVLEGTRMEGYTVFKGVPYAKPPVGELRWKAPQEPEKWTGVRKADHFADIAWQDLPKESEPFGKLYYKEFYADPAYVPAMSEDCLYLNIWVPNGGLQENSSEQHSEKLPVAFWIHGGGFGGGYSSEMEFDGEKYAAKGVILVTVAYRLNVFGFLAHPWLSEENEKKISGNYGILDQIAALKWVYENISALGGDPQNITVFGQSAGSMSTQVLVSSPLTEGMIAKAIMQSGISCEEEILATPTLEQEEKYGQMFVECTGCTSIEELRELSAEKMMEAKRKLDAKLWESGAGIVIVPNVDGYVLNKSVKEVWKSSEMRQIPYLCGTVTADLGAVPEQVEKGEAGILMEECRRWSRKCEETYGQPAWLYHFGHPLPGDQAGAFHSSEIWYMFGTLDRCWRPMEERDYEISTEMVNYWTDFMKYGTPDRTGDTWKPYSENNKYIKEFR